MLDSRCRTTTARTRGENGTRHRNIRTLHHPLASRIHGGADDGVFRKITTSSGCSVESTYPAPNVELASIRAAGRIYLTQVETEYGVSSAAKTGTCQQSLSFNIEASDPTSSKTKTWKRHIQSHLRAKIRRNPQTKPKCCEWGLKSLFLTVCGRRFLFIIIFF